ncbi:MAG: response regulator transcription factor [Candidatus Woesebacteria bacterium]|jgi:two-component system OmpR family response regulator
MVEDQVALAKIVKNSFKKSFVVDLAQTGKEALYQASVTDYQAIILDIGLPDVDGFTVCQQLRSAKIDCPILILSAHGKLSEKVRGLDLGADDYLTKPFELLELQARVRALLRRKTKLLSSKLTLGALSLDFEKRKVAYQNIDIPLNKKEFLILGLLMQNPGRIFSREAILEQVWPNPYSSSSNLVDVYISFLRKKIDRRFGVKFIRTVHGRGYRVVGMKED